MTVPRSYYDDQPLRLGPEQNLLIDDYLVEDRWALTRVLHHPVRFPRNPILLRDRPWEGDVTYRPSVMWDPEYGRYRMWYMCFSFANYYGAGGPPYYFCYAESDDAFNWEKPALPGGAYPGYERSNVVYCGTHHPHVSGVQVFRDAADPDPSRRYKMICLERGAPGREQPSGVHLACSADGLQWRLAGPGPILDYHSDCVNHVVHDPEADQWLLYCRPIHMSATGRRAVPGQVGSRHTKRRVAVMTSRDFVHWSYPRTCLYPDELDTPDYDSVNVFRYGNQFLMLYAALEGEETGAGDVRLATSRDGLHWERFHTREPFLDRGRDGDWDAGQVLADGPPVAQSGQLLFYYSGFTHPQYHPTRNGGIGVATFPADHFVEQRAGDQPGYLLTREFVFEGNRLRLNTIMPGRNYREQGTRVEVVQRPQLGRHGPQGPHAVPGLGLEECDPVRGTRADSPVSWRDDPDLSRLTGQPVYLRFEMRNMGLFSFQVKSE